MSLSDSVGCALGWGCGDVPVGAPAFAYSYTATSSEPTTEPTISAAHPPMPNASITSPPTANHFLMTFFLVAAGTRRARRRDAFIRWGDEPARSLSAQRIAGSCVRRKRPSDNKFVLDHRDRAASRWRVAGSLASSIVRCSRMARFRPPSVVVGSSDPRIVGHGGTAQRRSGSCSASSICLPNLRSSSRSASKSSTRSPSVLREISFRTRILRNLRLSTAGLTLR